MEPFYIVAIDPQQIDMKNIYEGTSSLPDNYKVVRVRRFYWGKGAAITIYGPATLEELRSVEELLERIKKSEIGS